MYGVSGVTSDVHLPRDLHGGGEVPHLDAAVAVATEEVAAWPGADATRTLALVDHEGGDGGTVYGPHLTHPDTHTHTHNTNTHTLIHTIPHTLKQHTHRKKETHKPLPVGGQSDVEFIRIRNDSLDKHLLLIPLPIRT